jgi:SIT4-associating protein SAP185/190
MFWRFGGYANISTIDTVLDKPDVTLEEVLEESDLIQEIKHHNTKLIEFLRDDNVLQQLLEYVVAPPIIGPEDEDDGDEEEEKQEQRGTFSPVRSLSLGRSRNEKSRKQEEHEEREKLDKARQKHAYLASEILSSDTWSIIEALMENRAALTKFWDFLRRKPALDPVTAGYFTKINETLLDKKTEETLEFVKSLEGIVPAMLQHVDCPMVMDLLLKIISMEKAEGGQGIVDVSNVVLFCSILMVIVASNTEFDANATRISWSAISFIYSNFCRRFY